MRYTLQLFVLILLIFPFSITHSQSGKISGKVTDIATNEPLPFVNILIEGTNTGAASDLDGNYFIINVPPGTYSVRASAIGYNSVTVRNINVASGFTTNIDFTLVSTALELSEDVVVIATKPLVQKDLTASTSVVSDELISQLPVTEIRDVLQLQAGIVSEGADLHIRGGRKGQIAFQIDGVPVTDSYDGSTVIDVAADAVKELQVISGAFNAEYGQAMSGVVNIVTKDGDNNFRGSLTTYAGDYVSDKTKIFWDIDDIDVTAIRNIEGSLSGPVVKDNLFFYVNGRYYYNTGHIFGRRLYLTTDRAIEVPGSAGELFNITRSGDSAYVSMNPNERFYGQGKLTYRLLEGMKVSYNYIYDKQKYKQFDKDNYLRRLTPDNNLQRFRTGITNTLSINHAISASSFYTLNLSYFFKEYHHYLYEEDYYPLPFVGFEDYKTSDPNTSTPYVDNFIRQRPPYHFDVGGSDYERFNRFTNTYSLKLDWATQLNQEINIQFGGEFKRHSLYYHKITLYPYYDNNGLHMAIFPLSSTNQDEYLHKPTETSAYVQSKFEAFNLIFNIGLRLDVFNPDGYVLSDPTDPNVSNPLRPDNRFHDLNGNGEQDPGEASKTDAERLASNAFGDPWYKEASIKYQISPRIGLAFPITDKGVIHFSYGHFLQLPPYEYMYQNPEFELGSGSGNQGLFGNADLRPQKTVKGEIGLQQQIGDDMAVDFTVFFEDFRDLTGTQNEEILVFGRGSSYSRYANSDFGFSKGFIVKFEKRFSGGLATSVDYTYSVTKGNASNPADARDASIKGALPETFIAPLNWDQTHTLNLSIAYTKPRDYGFSLIGNFYTGQPFTPVVNKNTRVTQNAFPRNSQAKPTNFNLDLRLYKDFPIGPTTISVFLKVFNLLDLDNPTTVYDNSGDPFFTFEQLDAEKVNPKLYNGITLDDFYTRADYFSEPRRIEVGMSYNF
jgi:hypothetical protein